ncbi:MAG TPA: bifunctional adenosylcobinamide kinase/adenosylcobinamide-phosphate guanylyltransferase [Thermoleophilaceae bacterium]
MGLTLLIGGARSGKSSMAVQAAQGSSAAVIFVATAEALDEEFERRIAHHRAERPAGWRVVEEPLALADVLFGVADEATVVIDCLSLWVANLIGREDTSDEIADVARRTAKLAAGRNGQTYAVTNEVGMGIVPANAVARRYRDELGRVNATWAAAADEVLLVVAGVGLPLSKP